MLQEREYERVGSNHTLKADVRILAATNQDLEARLAEGLFRRDLYYRINVFPITLPPLRDRKDDILLLADHFVAKYAKKMAKEVRRISTPAINMMLAYHWPGNVRELENCIEYGVLLSSDGVIHGHSLPPTLQLPQLRRIGPAGASQDPRRIVGTGHDRRRPEELPGERGRRGRAAGHHAAHGPLQDEEARHRSPAILQPGRQVSRPLLVSELVRRASAHDNSFLRRKALRC